MKHQDIHTDEIPEKSNIDQPSSTRASVWKDVLSMVGVLALALVFAFGLITFVFQTYQVSGVSMEQTLHNGDHLVVIKLPRTWSKITGHAYVPKRGDIIILKDSAEALTVCEADRGSQLVKRVVGLPGDHVVVAGGKVTIFDKQYPYGFSPDKLLPYRDQITEKTNGNVNIRLGQNQIFVMGDNRLNSCDSRFFGPVNLNQIVGEVALRLLPIGQAKAF